MSQEICINFYPIIDLYFQRFDKVSKVNFDPSFFNRSLNFCNLYLDLLQIGYLFIKEVQIRDNFSTAFQ